MSNILYDNLAEIYDKIADDRSFKAECEDILSIYQKFNKKRANSVLELFAGPAYHSEVFQNEYGIKSIAIDGSEQMKELACYKHNIDHQNYIVGMLPHILTDTVVKLNSSYDIVLLMRYSLGLIDYENVERLLMQLTSLLSPNGIVLIELHNLNLLFNHFNGLKIKERKKYLPETKQSISCIWPSGPLTWNTEQLQVFMPIQIELTEENGNKEVFKTESIEYVYTTSEIDRIIKNMPLSRKTISSNLSKESINLIVLQKGTL